MIANNNKQECDSKNLALLPQRYRKLINFFSLWGQMHILSNSKL